MWKNKLHEFSIRESCEKAFPDYALANPFATLIIPGILTSVKGLKVP